MSATELCGCGCGRLRLDDPNDDPAQDADRVRDYACPILWCRALPGEDCRTPMGELLRPHRARVGVTHG